MKEFGQTEIVQSLKDDSIHMLIIGGIFTENIETIKQELENDNRKGLAIRIKSRLNDKGYNTLESANIFEENGNLSDLGMAHVYSYLQTNGVEGIKIKPKTKNSQEENPDDEISAIIFLSLSKFKLTEIRQLFDEKKEKILSFYIVQGMSDLGIKKVLELGIITIDNHITDLGWNAIKKYIEIQSLHAETNSKQEVQNTLQKKWWEFWK